MAKRKSNRGRDTSVIANDPRQYTLPLGQPSVRRRQLELFPIEDRRTFTPEGPRRSLLSLSGRKHRLVATNRNPMGDPLAPLRISFEAPKRLLLCIRRNQRKEVLFAKKKAGKTGQKRPKRNFFSSISCKE